jgi:hypothetical protein
MKDCLDQAGPHELISIKTKKHKSLGVLSLVFIKLFFEKSKTLTIEEVVQFFAETESEESDMYFKSQTRRLYDIANVLKSLGVIEKVKYFQPKAEKNQKERKNAFKWVGAKGFNLLQDDIGSLQISDAPKISDAGSHSNESSEIYVEKKSDSSPKSEGPPAATSNSQLL